MSTTTAVATQNKRDIRDFLQSDAVKDQLALALPKHITADRMARVACTAILKAPKLMECKPESLLQALMLCSQTGLEPDGRNAHLIPYGDQVQVIFDYKGLVALAERNGVECIYADKICEEDEFKAWVDNGEKKLNHTINFRKPRGNAYAYYASCRRSGRLDYEVMTKDDVDAIRKRSRAGGSGPWVTDYDEMAKKTVIRRMSKRWDISPEISEALNGDFDTPQFGQSQVVIEPAAFVRKTEPAFLTGVSIAPSLEPVAAEPVPEAPAAPALPAVVQDLVMFVRGKNVDWDKFKKGVVGTNLFEKAKDWNSWSDVDEASAARLLKNQSGLERILK